MVSDYGMIARMEHIAISKFKATCLAVLERVRRTRKPVLVTRFGEAIAEIVPPTPREQAGSRLGGMQGRAKILGDIIGPAVEEKDWEALR